MSTVPYTFATASGNVPASQLDANFSNVKASVDTAVVVTAEAQPNIRSVGTLTSLTVSGNVNAANFIGNGSSLSSITGANVTGTVPVSATATTAGTVTTAAQSNITSVGTLTSLTVTGNVTGGNLLTGGLISATGNITAGNVIASNLSGPVFMANVLTGQGIPTSPSGISQLPLMYDNISSNIGGGYAVGNSVIGSTFTAPVSGFYQVSSAIGVTPSNWANVASYSSAGVIGVYVNDNPVASGPLIDFAGIVISNIILQVTTSSSISTLVKLDVGDTLKCKLAYITTAPSNFWNTSTNLVQGYFQACWIRGI